MTPFRRLLSALTIATFAMPAAWAAGQAKPPALDVYGRLPGFETAAMSPSGDRVAIIGVVGDQRSLFLMGPEDKVLVAADIGDAKIRWIYWADEDRVLLNVSHTVNLGMGFTADKAELSNVLVVSVKDPKPWRIFERDPEIVGGVRGFYGIRRMGSQTFAYFGGMEREKVSGGLLNAMPHLYRVDLDKRRSSKIAERSSQDLRRDWAVGSDGKVAATLDFVRDSGRWSIRNGKSNRLIAGSSPTGGISLMNLGRTDRSVVFREENEATGIAAVFEQPIEGGAAEPLLQGESLAGLIYDDHSNLLTGFVREGDTPEDHFFDAARQKAMVAARKAFAGKTVKLIDSNAAFDQLIVRTDGPGDPQSWWRIDLKTRRASSLGFSYALLDQQVGPMRMYRYKAADGLEIGGVLTLPPGRDPKKLPIIVLPHGGPSARDYPVFNWWAQAFASRGYAVFQPNFRGSTGISASFERAGHGQWGRKMQTDISDGLAQLAKDGIVDPKRACIVGASYGGYAALAGVTLQQGLYKCAVSVAGVADVNALYSTEVTESGGDRTMIRWLKQEVGSGRDLKAISPIRFADRADAPILLIHGKDDIVVLYSQSSAMQRALAKAGKPVELVTLKGEDHWLSKSETRLAMLKAAVEFVDKHNPAN